MKRAVIAVAGLVVAGAAVFSIVKGVQYFAWTVRLDQHIVESSRREPGAIADWKKTFGDPDTVLAFYSKHEDNQTAVRLMELAPAMGVEFRGAHASDVSPPAIGKYVDAELMKSAGVVGRPPDDVQAYLDAHIDGIRSVVDLLSSSEPPVWRRDLSLWPLAPVPNLVALRRVSSLLAAEALSESAQGHAGAAERALRASWQMVVSIRDPSARMIEQLIAAPILSMNLGLVRRLPVDPAPWRERIADLDPRASFLMTLEIEAIQRRPSGQSDSDRASYADYLDGVRPYLIGLQSLVVTGDACGGGTGDAAAAETFTQGQAMAAIMQTGANRAWCAISHIALETELTDRVLQARQLKAQSGRWPESSPGLEASRVPGVHWTYTVRPDGHLIISLTPAWSGPGAPLRYESAPSTLLVSLRQPRQ